jgi:predicted transcriptional regulator
MLTNYERVMKQFIPAFRSKAARMMVNEYRIKQQDAAVMLGTTQAAISKYLKGKDDKFGNVNIDGMSLKNFIERMNVKDEANAQKIMCTMCQSNKKFNCAFIVK